VYAARVAKDIRGAMTPNTGANTPKYHSHISPAANCTQGVADLRSVMYANAGLVRNDTSLRDALARLEELHVTHPAQSSEFRNLLTVGRLIVESALARKESRGSHYRSDYPDTDQAFAKRSFTRLQNVA
jgi:L-aspartate oxidase